MVQAYGKTYARQILTKLALLLFTGESWGRQEATTLFFGSRLAYLELVYIMLNEDSLETFPEQRRFPPSDGLSRY
jgi:hypothetical protein